MYWNPGRIYDMGTHKQVNNKRKPTLAYMFSCWYSLCDMRIKYIKKEKTEKNKIHLRVSKSRENFSLAVGIMVDYLIQ